MGRFSRMKEFAARDPMGTFFYVTRRIYINFRMAICTGFIYLSSHLKRLQIKRGCKFFGMTVFYRYPESRISIGEACIFRSDSTNYIGRNEKCLLVTSTQHAIIEIGDRSGFNGVTIHSAEKVTIGSDVLIGFNVLIDDSDHHTIDPKMRHGDMSESRPIIIEDNVWLGSRVVVLKGVTIGRNSVVGSNSVVRSDIPSNCLAFGNPCIVVKKI